jgi:4-amino-4-deoxy-L-arabinose transferase-like glycosyltransferase
MGLVAIAAVALAARLALILATPHFALFGDPVDYQRHAVSIAAGHGFPTTQIASPGTPSAFRPPGYPFLLGGLYAVVGDHPDAARVLGALLGVLAVILLAYLGRAVWTPRIGLLAGGLAAIYLPLIALNATLLSESLFIPVEVGFVLCLVACTRHRDQLRWPILAGVLCALAALTRAVADVWLVPALVVMLGAGITARMRWRSAVAAVVAFALVLAPWTIRNLTVFHTVVPISTEDGFTLAGQYNTDAGANGPLLAVWRIPIDVASLRRKLLPLYTRPGGIDEPALDHTLRSDALQYFERHPGHLAVAIAYDTLRMFDIGPGHAFTTSVAYHELALPLSLHELTSLSAQLATLLAVVGLVAWLTRRWPIRLGPWWLRAIPLLTAALTVPSVGNPIKRAPLDPFILLLAAVTIDWLLALQFRRRARG